MKITQMAICGDGVEIELNQCEVSVNVSLEEGRKHRIGDEVEIILAPAGPKIAAKKGKK